MQKIPISNILSDAVIYNEMIFSPLGSGQCEGQLQIDPPKSAFEN